MNNEKLDVDGVFANLIKAQCNTSSNVINNVI